MTRLENKNSQEPVHNSEEAGEAMDAIIGEVPSRRRGESDDDDKEFDEANEPSGDPAKNVPSA
jgi:hypothetical protein